MTWTPCLSGAEAPLNFVSGLMLGTKPSRGCLVVSRFPPTAPSLCSAARLPSLPVSPSYPQSAPSARPAFFLDSDHCHGGRGRDPSLLDGLPAGQATGEPTRCRRTHARTHAGRHAGTHARMHAGTHARTHALDGVHMFSHARTLTPHPTHAHGFACLHCEVQVSLPLVCSPLPCC